jgi:hypothetical protein
MIIGVAGGLSPELEAGDLVVGDSIAYCRGDTALAHVSGVSLPCRQAERSAAWLHGALAPRAEVNDWGNGSVGVGRITTVDGIVANPEHKASLWRLLGSPARATVDMESFHVAQIFEERSIPWTVLRAVSDPATTALPAWLPGCVGSDGTILRRRVVAGLLLRPRSLARLLGFRREVRRAAERLGDGVGALLRRCD